jgi:hypothetical protein
VDLPLATLEQWVATDENHRLMEQPLIMVVVVVVACLIGL